MWLDKMENSITLATVMHVKQNNRGKKQPPKKQFTSADIATSVLWQNLVVYCAIETRAAFVH